MLGQLCHVPGQTCKSHKSRPAEAKGRDQKLVEEHLLNARVVSQTRLLREKIAVAVDAAASAGAQRPTPFRSIVICKDCTDGAPKSEEDRK